MIEAAKTINKSSEPISRDNKELLTGLSLSLFISPTRQHGCRKGHSWSFFAVHSHTIITRSQAARVTGQHPLQFPPTRSANTAAFAKQANGKKLGQARGNVSPADAATVAEQADST